MLAELAAANTAYQIIKKTVQNGGEIAKAGKAIGQFLTAKEDLMREGNKKRARGVGGNDLEEFMALEQIREKENELKQLMILSGLPPKNEKCICFTVKFDQAPYKNCGLEKTALTFSVFGAKMHLRFVY